MSLQGPTGVPTDTQAEWYQGQSANPLAAALLLQLLRLLHVCECDQHWTCFHKHRDSSTPRQTREIPVCPRLIRHIFLVVKVGTLIDLLLQSSHCKFHYTRAEGNICPVWTFASSPAINLLYMNGSFSTISAAFHVLTSWTFCTCSLELLE